MNDFTEETPGNRGNSFQSGESVYNSKRRLIPQEEFIDSVSDIEM